MSMWLNRSVPPHQHEALCKGLAVYLGAKDPKFSDNDVLRPPGTNKKKDVVACAVHRSQWTFHGRTPRYEQVSLRHPRHAVKRFFWSAASAGDRYCRAVPGAFARAEIAADCSAGI